ncbi:MAG: hypothetical protein B6D64_12670 [Bacteroidetes bacterium 4484_276]|nr:MAG: hypothetical protein B6D64_12670 [Bacteroidetes bacterium 4484_276]
MEQLINKGVRKGKISQSSIWNDSLIQNYYDEFYNNLTLSEMDKAFNTDIKTLSKLLSKLNDSEKQVFIGLISNHIRNYIERKVEKQIETLFNKTLRF